MPELNLASAAMQRLFMLDRLMQVYREALPNPGGGSFFENLLSIVNVRPKVTQSDLDRIPAHGPVVVVANHPSGIVESAILAALLPAVRPDVKFMANSLLCQLFPAIANQIIAVDPFGGEAAIKANRKGMRDALRHLDAGGMLVVFPAGEVTHLHFQKFEITDSDWSPTVARLVRITRSSVLPIYFSGVNSAWFQVLGLLHPRLRTLMLVHEFFHKRNQNLDVRVGSLITDRKLQTMQDDVQMMDYLRRRTYFLKHRTAQEAKAEVPAAQAEAIADAIDPTVLQSEIDSLPESRRLTEAAECCVYYATAHEIPNILYEIGRLRETAFRDAGEGTGKAIDLDSCDAYYLQLFIWNKTARQIVGAYRIGPVDSVVKRYGKNGLYSSSLFAFDNRFLAELGDALELGRSFVRVEYQKSYTPLLLLWKGIGAYIAQNPRYKTLFGPVSISNSYQRVSRQLMVTFFREQNGAKELIHLVRARRPLRENLFRQPNHPAISDMDDLSAMVADIETDQKGIPVLLRQYLKLGGRFVGFHVDRNFSDTLDGLIVVDLTRTDPKMLTRYLGAEGSANFLEFHGAAVNS